MSNAVNFAYESGDDAESVDEVEKPPRKTRGRGIIWNLITVHPTLVATLESRTVEGSTPRLKGRNNRGKTSSYYSCCTMKSCGCTKQWRFCTALDTDEVTEEESAGEHSHHDDLQRNGGRGLSFNQVKIVDEMHAMKITKPLLIIDNFIKKAKDLHEAGEFWFENLKFRKMYCEKRLTMLFTLQIPPKCWSKHP
jgi:hypothetical protein